MSFEKWEKSKISDCCEIIGGGTPKTSVAEYWNGDIPWLSVVDFNNNDRHVFTTEKLITEQGLHNSSTKLLNKGDIIISARGTVGALAQLAIPMAFNQSCYGLRSINSVKNDFLYYAIKNIMNQINANTHGSVFDTITSTLSTLIL
jgi:type I restriction enzyme S subunit